MKKLTVTVGLSVYNEEKNIKRMIEQLLKQKETSFVLKTIMLVSDGSTDATGSIIAKMKNKKIHYIHDQKRLGKPTRINHIFKIAATDVIIILDADILIPSTHFLEKLVAPFIKSSKTDLVSGVAYTLPANTWVEKITGYGILIWEDIKHHAKNAEMYTCEGQVRAFSRKLYKKLRFPVFSADDVYPYIFCKEQGYGYELANDAIVYYKLPGTIRDYLHQHVRYLQSEAIQENNFSKATVENYYTITAKTKLMQTIKHFIKNPVLTSAYLSLLVLPKIAIHFTTTGREATWKIITSTKN